MTRIVPRLMHGEPRYADETTRVRFGDGPWRYPDEYWHAEDATRRPSRAPIIWTVVWVAAAVIAVYAVVWAGIAWWM